MASGERLNVLFMDISFFCLRWLILFWVLSSVCLCWHYTYKYFFQFPILSQSTVQWLIVHKNLLSTSWIVEVFKKSLSIQQEGFNWINSTNWYFSHVFSLTNAKSTKTTTIGSVRVSSNHEQSGKGIVLQDDLMDDTRAGLPEADAVLSARGL